MQTDVNRTAVQPNATRLVDTSIPNPRFVAPSFQSRRSESGSALVTTLLLAMVITIALEGFLVFLTTEYRMVHRTYSFGSGIYLAEAGIDEGIAMLNNGDNNWSANGWSSLGSSNFTKTISNFTSGDGSTIGQCQINIIGASSNNPVVVCTGIVNTAHASGSATGLTNITRVVQTILGRRPIFNWALLAQSWIDLAGNTIWTDSYDSLDPNHSNFDLAKGYGTYDEDEKKDNGDIATNATITNSLGVGNATVFGHVATGPGGTIDIGSGFVGTLAGYEAGTNTVGYIDPSRESHSMNMDLLPPEIPVDSAAPNLGTINKSRSVSGGVTDPRDYVAESIALAGTDSLTFKDGYTRLLVKNNVSTSGGASIVVAPGSKVEIYVLGSVSLGGGGVINDSGNAISFQLYKYGSDSVSIGGNGAFTGVIYAPESPVTCVGSGSGGVVYGSIVGYTIDVTGNMTFHYDEALKVLGPFRGYSILAWQEL